MTPAVRVDSLTFTYPGPDGYHLDVPHLELDAGARVACIGPSGCGKTTLIHLIAGILRPHHGTVALADTMISELDDTARRAHRVRRIGLVFQRFELLPYLSARDNILLPYHINPGLRAGPTTDARAGSLAESLSITHVLKRRPDRLSQGERQRVAIARALITEPELVLCDEPTGNLDPATADATLQLLLEEATRRNATLLMVTHNHTLLDRFDRVVELPGMAAQTAAGSDGAAGGGGEVP